MPKVFYTLPDGTQRVVEAGAGDSVMQTAVRNGVTGIVAQCGGELSCATCHVFVHADALAMLPEPSEDENDMLDGTAVERAENSRLSCQLVLADGQDLHVSIPEEQL